MYDVEQKELDIKKAINHDYKEDELSMVDFMFQMFECSMFCDFFYR